MENHIDDCCENILMAIVNCCVKCIENFGKNGDIFEKDESDGMNMFHFVVFYVPNGRQKDIIKILLKFNGYDRLIDSKCFDGDTPLHIASGYCKYDIVDILLRHGADQTILNRGFTPYNLGNDKVKKIFDDYNALEYKEPDY